MKLWAADYVSFDSYSSIKIDFDGATNPAATDVVHWFAMENGAD